MSMSRINVNSGRPLEALAHYSRALRVGECVLQSGTTAIDREGRVIGEGDIGRQVDAIFAIAGESMAAAGGRLEDVVSARLYVTDASLVDDARRAAGRHLRDARPTASVVPVRALARPTQLVEIELEAIDGAATAATRVVRGDPSEARDHTSAAIRMGDRIWVSGAAEPSAAEEIPTVAGQTRRVFTWIEGVLGEVDASIADLVCVRSSLCELADLSEHRTARLEALGETRPASTLVVTPPFSRPRQRLEVEVEARVGAAAGRRELYSESGWERPLGFASALCAGDRIYLSGAVALDERQSVPDPGDWARQCDRCIEQLSRLLDRAGSCLADVVQRRTFSVAGVEMNRRYGEGPPWFAPNRPAALGCRIDALVHPHLVVEIDAVAVRGAHAGIEWRELEA